MVSSRWPWRGGRPDRASRGPTLIMSTEKRESILAELEKVENRINDLRNRIKATDSDEELQTGDTRPEDVFEHGQKLRLVVEDAGSGTKHGDPMARTEEGIVTFLNPNDHEIVVGDLLDARVTKLANNHMRATVLGVVD